ncbi:hypothetical protein, partial [Bacteroides acidifaciens]|uniref:hypothetical protein n=1 Tax=Bacteroides acidifaciens TaxID=85831 RepID=UPI0030143439
LITSGAAARLRRVLRRRLVFFRDFFFFFDTCVVRALLLVRPYPSAGAAKTSTAATTIARNLCIFLNLNLLNKKAKYQNFRFPNAGCRVRRASASRLPPSFKPFPLSGV